SLHELLGEEVTKERVAACFTRGGYKAEDASRLADHVLATLGMKGEGSVNVDREQLFSTWRLLIEVLSWQAKYILIFENLQWASDSLLDLVAHISSLRVQRPFLMITVSRPELLDRRPNWGGGRQNFTALTLQPLSAKRSYELVKKLAPDLPEKVSGKIAESCEGNPFFAQELVRGLAERGLAGQAATIDILPDTVHAAVLARLDLLSKPERDVLQVASVASSTFTAELFQSVLPAYGAEEIAGALNSLLARDMLAPATGGAFTFHHGLIRDVTYGTLARAERIRLHKAIAAFLLESAGEHVDECVELLAYHYYKAVELSRQSAVPQKLEVETERAIKFQVRAGELACQSGAFGEAITYFENAIQLAGDADKLILYEELGDNLGLQWRVKIREVYRKALHLWRTLPDHQPLIGARLIRKLVIQNYRWSFADKMPQEDAEALWREGLRLAEQAGDEDELWRIRSASVFMTDDLNPLGVEEMRQSEKVRELKQLAEEASGYFEQRQDWETLSEILDGYSALQFRCGENSEATTTVQRRLQLTNLSSRERMDITTSIVSVNFLSGEYEAARQVMEEALDNLRPEDPFEGLGNAMGTVMWGQYLTGHWSNIARFRRPLDEICKRVQDIEGAGGPVANGYQALLMIALSREEQAEAETLLALLRKLVPQFFELLEALALMYRDGDLSRFKVGRRGESIAGLQIMLFTEHEQCPPAGLLKQGDYYADDMTLRATNIAKALIADDNEALARAIDEAEEHQLIVHAAHMRIVLAKRTGDRSQLERARPMLERLEDRLFLRKLYEVEELLQTA
ncbi:MAG TPA: hypothetical protein VKV19_18465, partial [Ktedonobacteraceae bacterium]|nr:hypothetical protein [Ktedonobacteraceae bacterium]